MWYRLAICLENFPKSWIWPEFWVSLGVMKTTVIPACYYSNPFMAYTLIWAELSCWAELLSWAVELSCWAPELLSSWAAELLSCWAAELLSCWAAELLSSWAADLLNCWAELSWAIDLSCWAAELLSCWAAELLSCRAPKLLSSWAVELSCINLPSQPLWYRLAICLENLTRS